ncbi:MAG: prolipoprotein diacylglyceryl transferase [Candidatus Cloacimonadales bacterium]|jgi:phosphatidylglycerol:prolipoprotein diacylglycerol transferase|nr:prolipoprotein diacylglyceryl transferase [Candidatus Cloacimonadota bacterium]MDD2650453.1 prolipoprotein diacylglyceryl transferase [Candidatus Cloacimonadota bacterium]MDX9976672.1 prolipoprotein diacylglyceryl transferase [Candidatus Cloacimonadales bacterium]
MNHYIHNLNPTIFTIGSLEIRWYGLFYVISFLLAYWLIKKNFKHRNIVISNDDYDTFVFNLMLGVIIGGRIGYMLFYNLSYYIHKPIAILYFWQGGMSFHGGALGVIIAGLIFCRKHKLSFYQLADPVMPIVAIGLGLGRLGNFINGELFGRVTSLPWGMIFINTDPQALIRHPSQLYELFLEGIVLAILLQWLYKKTKTAGLIFWAFIGGYGLIRFILEYFREPDNIDLYKNGLILNHFTMGQVLSFSMIVASVIFITFLLRKRS